LEKYLYEFLTHLETNFQDKKHSFFLTLIMALQEIYMK